MPRAIKNICTGNEIKAFPMNAMESFWGNSKFAAAILDCCAKMECTEPSFRTVLQESVPTGRLTV